MGILPAEQAQADSTNFNTTLTALSGSAFQLDSNFSILYDLDVAYLDTNLDNVPDSEMFFGGGLFLGDYLDPEHYGHDSQYHYHFRRARLRAPRDGHRDPPLLHGN